MKPLVGMKDIELDGGYFTQLVAMPQNLQTGQQLPLYRPPSFAMQTQAILHPPDPITGSEIKLAVKVLEAKFPGVPLRYEWIDVQEPLKNEAVPLIE